MPRAGDYLVVKDLGEAQYVCDYILKGGIKQEFLDKFSKAVSKVRRATMWQAGVWV